MYIIRDSLEAIILGREFFKKLSEFQKTHDSVSPVIPVGNRKGHFALVFTVV